jgi:flagella basal body P-ring formation protein FlgA
MGSARALIVGLTAAFMALLAPESWGDSAMLKATGPEAAGDALRRSLEQRYPQVVRWSIQPFADKSPAGEGPATVAQIGPRSAVRVRGRLYWYRVEGYQAVVTATHRILPREALDARAGRLSEADVLSAGCDPLTDPLRLNGARAVKLLQVDEVVCRQSIEPRPPVASGDEVTVRYVSAHVMLTTHGVAQRDGALGDELPVRGVPHGQVFAAVVSGPKEVTIHD